MESPHAVAAAATTPRVRLYSALSVFVATFLGSALAGAHLLARNYRRLGDRRASRRTWIICAGGHIVLVAIGTAVSLAFFHFEYNTEFTSITVALNLVVAAIMGVAAQLLQGRSVRGHRSAGGQLDKSGGGVVVLWAVVNGFIVFGLPWALQQGPGRLGSIPGHSELVSDGGAAIDVRYDGITRAEASAFGQRIAASGYATPGTTVQVFVTRSAGIAVVTFPVQDGVWNRPAIADGFRALIAEAAPAIGGLPIRGRLVDAHLQEKAMFLVE